MATTQERRMAKPTTSRAHSAMPAPDSTRHRRGRRPGSGPLCNFRIASTAHALLDESDSNEESFMPRRYVVLPAVPPLAPLKVAPPSRAHRPAPTEPPTPPQPPAPTEPDTVPDPTREPPEPDTPPIGDPPPQPNQTPHGDAATTRMQC